jgi:hypothetical protein
MRPEDRTCFQSTLPWLDETSTPSRVEEPAQTPFGVDGVLVDDEEPGDDEPEDEEFGDEEPEALEPEGFVALASTAGVGLENNSFG